MGRHRTSAVPPPKAAGGAGYPQVREEGRCPGTSFLLFQVRTLFVSGLPLDIKPRELYLLFRPFKVLDWGGQRGWPLPHLHGPTSLGGI